MARRGEECLSFVGVVDCRLRAACRQRRGLLCVSDAKKNQHFLRESCRLAHRRTPQTSWPTRLEQQSDLLLYLIFRPNLASDARLALSLECQSREKNDSSKAAEAALLCHWSSPFAVKSRNLSAYSKLLSSEINK